MLSNFIEMILDNITKKLRYCKNINC